MEVKCEVCGEMFEAKRRTARFCSSGCRVRAHRAGGKVVELKPAAKSKPAGKAPAAAPAPAGEEAGPVEAAAVKQLEEAGRLDTPLGQAALVLARRLDRTTMDTGSAIAGVVKQLEATLAAATAGAKQAEDPVDELRKRRDQKLGIVS